MTVTSSSGIRRTFAAVVALAALLPAGGAAAGSFDSEAVSRLEPQELRALTIRGRALNCLHGAAATCMTPSELRALQIRSEGLNSSSGVSKQSGASFVPGVTDFPSRGAYIEPGWSPPKIGTVSTDTFNWGDAGIGAGLATSAVLLVAGALTLRTRRRLAGNLGTSSLSVG